MTLRNAVVLLALALAAAQASGQWSPAVNLSNSPNEWSVDACMDFDANGKVHIVYRDWWESTNRIYYIENVTGVWSARQLIATTSAAKPLLRITPDNVLHVFYKANSQLNYVFKSIGAANWSAPAKVNHDGSWCGDKACGDKWPAWAVVDASGGLFFSYIYLWDDNSSGPKSALWGRYKPLGGAWGPVELVEPGPNRDSWPAESQLVAQGNTIYATWDLNGARFKSRSAGPSGIWGSTRTIDGNGGAGRVAFSPDGQMAAAWHKDVKIGDQWFEVFVKFSNDGGLSWFGEMNVSNAHNGLDRIPEITFDANGDLHVIYQRFDCDGCQPEMWYRKYDRIAGTWSSISNITNTTGRTGAGFQAIRAFGNDLHFIYTDNTGNGIEELFYRTTTVTPPGNTGTITGVITSTLGQPVSNVHVVTAPGNFGATSNPNGVYTISHVPVGTYSLTATRDGHYPATVNNVVVQNGQTTTADILITGIAPSNVGTFTVTAGNTSNLIAWSNSPSQFVSGTMIRYSTTAPPATPNDGILLVDRPGGPYTAENFTHTGLTNGTTYYYTAFAYYSAGGNHYASGVSASGTPHGPGDFDHDGDVDQADFGFLQRCLAGPHMPISPECVVADLEPAVRDFDVDSADVAVFLACFSGPNIPADPNCAP